MNDNIDICLDYSSKNFIYSLYRASMGSIEDQKTINLFMCVIVDAVLSKYNKKVYNVNGVEKHFESDYELLDFNEFQCIILRRAALGEKEAQTFLNKSLSFKAREIFYDNKYTLPIIKKLRAWIKPYLFSMIKWMDEDLNLSVSENYLLP